MPEHRFADPRFAALEASIARIHRDQAHQPDQLAQHGATVDPQSPAGRRALRGIPCIANGVGGTQPGTHPLQELLARERQSKRDRASQ